MKDHTKAREAVRQALHAYEDALRHELLEPLSRSEANNVRASRVEVRAAMRVLCMENR